MNNTHISSAFDRDLEGIQTLLMKMGGLVEAAILESARALEDRDTDLATEVRKGDQVIDALEEQINADCARLIALRAPTATDLRTVLTVMKIASNLERCGDYAKNLAKRTLVLAEGQPIGSTTGSVRRLAKTVQGLLRDALDAFIRRDAALAEDVRMRDQDVDQMYNALFREFVTYMMEDSRNIGPMLHLHFIAKNIERVGDHATGIAEQVTYLITGQMPNDDRPKAETPAA
ncbi:MAG: phosphate signaling complex protein PhoU [Paracoccaceae bacterium]